MIEPTYPLSQNAHVRRRLGAHLIMCIGIGILVSACNWGVRPKDFAPANGPEGALVAVGIVSDPRDRIGELLAVDSVGVTIAASRVVRIAWSRVRAMDVERMSIPYDILPGERVTPEKRERLALVSRFPQGLSGDLLARVLRANNQDALEELK